MPPSNLLNLAQVATALVLVVVHGFALVLLPLMQRKGGNKNVKFSVKCKV